MMCRRSLVTLWLAAIAALGACDDDAGGPGGDADATGDIESDVGADETPDADDGDADVEAHAITGTVPLDFDLTVDGRGLSLVTAATFARSAGLVAIGRDLRALAYERTDWTAYGYVLYHVLAPEAGSLHVLYLYCGNESATNLDYIWHEAYGVPMAYEAAWGDCFAEVAPTDADVVLDALEVLPEPESIASGLVVNGPDAVLDDAGGFVLLAGREYLAHPFGLVDCTTTCSADPADGWWEIHTVLRDPTDGDRCFGTMYLMVASGDAVEFDYAFCLDSLTRLPDTSLDASWRRIAKDGDSDAVPRGPYVARAGHVLRPGPRLR
jgi:hypothetical protein